MKNSNNSPSVPERLGFIGLGNMGGAIALRLDRSRFGPGQDESADQSRRYCR